MEFVQFRRRYPRYRVAHVDQLKVEVVNELQLQHLVCISKGGCGFYSFCSDLIVEEGLKQERPLRAMLQFLWQDSPSELYEVQANIIYQRPCKVGGGYVYYYGLEFIPDHRKLIEPLLGRLEDWARAGRIARN